MTWSHWSNVICQGNLQSFVWWCCWYYQWSSKLLISVWPSVQKPHCRTHFNWNVEIFLTKFSVADTHVQAGVVITHGWLGLVTRHVGTFHTRSGEVTSHGWEFSNIIAIILPLLPHSCPGLWDGRFSQTYREAKLLLVGYCTDNRVTGRYRYLNGFNEP